MPAPWFVVCAFNNPHDIGMYKGLPSRVHAGTVDDAPYTLAVPNEGDRSNKAVSGTMRLDLNPLGFPQENANLPPTWNESLTQKPACQYESAFKVGLALSARGACEFAEGLEHLSHEDKLEAAVRMALNVDNLGMPLALTDDPELACRAFMQYYGYLIHEVDRHIDAVLKALEESGQADNTIVIFTADHGEYGGAHGQMMEKWFSSYEEFMHVPMVVRFPTSLHQVPGGIQQIDRVTSHIDMLPTILGLAGVDEETLATLTNRLHEMHFEVPEPVGADLSGLLIGQEDSVQNPGSDEERAGVLFTTYDNITAPLTEESDESDEGLTGYEVFCAAVQTIIGDDDTYSMVDAGRFKEGSVTQPNHIHSVVSQDGWKLACYYDPEDTVAQQYELYNLKVDSNEEHNLLVYDGAFPTVVDAAALPENLAAMHADIESTANRMMDLLVELEQQMLGETSTRPDSRS
jgi:hypothetical protein